MAKIAAAIPEDNLRLIDSVAMRERQDGEVSHACTLLASESLEHVTAFSSTMTDGLTDAGEVRLVAIDPTIGSEQRRNRPCLVIQRTS